MGRKKDPAVTKLRAEAQSLYSEGMSIKSIADKLGIRDYIARDYVLIKTAQKNRKPRKIGVCKCGNDAHVKFKKEPMCRECLFIDDDEPSLNDYVHQYRLHHPEFG